MAKSGRVILAVLAGAILWAVLWNIGTRVAQALFPELLPLDQPITHAGILVAYIGYSVVLSIAAGFVTAVCGGRNPMTAVWALATLQLTLGVVFEVSYWNLLPVWYHLVFLALIVPATVFGGVLRVSGRGATAHAAT